MATNPLYQNQLNQMLTDPGSYQGSPGFQFALNSGLGALNSSNSAMRGSGNALAALTKYGTGLAQQDYGNQRDFLGRMTGQEQQYGLGQEQNANTLALGSAANANQATSIANQFTLGQGQNANTARANDQNFGLGMYQAGNQYSLGQGQLANAAQGNANTAQNNWWNYQLGGQQNANTAANNQNNFNLGQGRNAIDWFGANTQRGTAQSNDWLNGQRNQRDWLSVYPQQRYA